MDALPGRFAMPALGSTVLEVGIGLVLMYLLLSLLASVINEMIAQLFALRAKTLEDGLVRLLHGATDRSTLEELKACITRLRGAATQSQSTAESDPVVARLLAHPLIAGMTSKG